MFFSIYRTVAVYIGRERAERTTRTRHDQNTRHERERRARVVRAERGIILIVFCFFQSFFIKQREYYSNGIYEGGKCIGMVCGIKPVIRTVALYYILIDPHTSTSIPHTHNTHSIIEHNTYTPVYNYSSTVAQ